MLFSEQYNLKLNSKASTNAPDQKTSALIKFQVLERFNIAYRLSNISLYECCPEFFGYNSNHRIPCINGLWDASLTTFHHNPNAFVKSGASVIHPNTPAIYHMITGVAYQLYTESQDKIILRVKYISKLSQQQMINKICASSHQQLKIAYEIWIKFEKKDSSNLSTCVVSGVHTISYASAKNGNVLLLKEKQNYMEVYTGKHEYDYPLYQTKEFVSCNDVGTLVNINGRSIAYDYDKITLCYYLFQLDTLINTFDKYLAAPVTVKMEFPQQCFCVEPALQRISVASSLGFSAEIWRNIPHSKKYGSHTQKDVLIIRMMYGSLRNQSQKQKNDKIITTYHIYLYYNNHECIEILANYPQQFDDRRIEIEISDSASLIYVEVEFQSKKRH